MYANEREVMKLRDMLEELDKMSKYIIYRDKDKKKEDKKVLKKMIKIIDKNELEDVVDELCE